MMLVEIVQFASTVTPPPEVAPAAQVDPDTNPLSYWLAPGGGLAVFAAALLAAARMFRDGRREDVKNARAAQEEAERERDDIERERDTLVDSVRRELAEVRRDLRERDAANDRKLREMSDQHARELQEANRQHLEQIRKMSAQHDAERKLDQDRIINLVADNFRMQELLAGRGWEPQSGRLQSMAAARDALARAVEEGATGDGTMSA